MSYGKIIEIILSRPAAKINPPKNTKIIFPNLIYALFIILGIKAKEIVIPTKKGRRILKFRSDMLAIINGYIPRASKKALPEIPGKSKKEHAKKPNNIKDADVGINSPFGG